MDERLDQKGGMHMSVPHLPQPSVHTPAIDFLPQTWKEVSMDVVLVSKKYNIIDSITIEDFRESSSQPQLKRTPRSSAQYHTGDIRTPSVSRFKSYSPQLIWLSLYRTMVETATLTLPTSDTVGGVSTGNVVDLPVSFHNLPLTALSDPAMQELLETVTDTPLVNLTLEGSADVTAKTTIGNVPIATIPFNVQSSLAVVDVVAGGTPDYLLITINTDLLNPSNITLETSSVTFALRFESVTIVSAIIDPLLLVPGNVICATQVHYSPQGSAVTQGEQARTYISRLNPR
ncbi:hypothetical protein FIBSPDRAFT_1053416 [Athelia psychrophila]|uniref:Uncharacterized protein n=1 Tax=Athelia psychrophila TaxID=1759441 RepID=A0A167WZ44_9AGAM|nr:hypothetical protein FIBSPDRAFT_1053416 [Fibularhizoctonia sp. CBS 109695]